MSTSPDPFLQACHGTEPIRLEIRRSSGAATVKDFAKPCILVGRDTRADLPLVNPDVAPRALYLQLIGGRLARLDAALQVGLDLRLVGNGRGFRSRRPSPSTG